MATQTANLKIKLIQPTDMFADETFNAVINDIDTKLVGIAHVGSKGHWDTWKASTKYEKDDIVRITDSKSNQYYQCIVAGTSDTLEPTNVTNGSLVVDGSATWKVMTIGAGGESNGISIWLSNNYYTKGQAVLYDNTLYRCKADHKAGTDFKSDSSNWQNVKANIKYWKKSIYYQPQDIVINDNKIYSCNTAHTSTTFSADISNWDLLDTFSLVEPFAISTGYEEGQFVTYNGILYSCNTRHISSSVDFATDLANWDVVYANTVDWDINTYYPKETIVLHDKLYYQCLTTHTSSADFEADRANWQLLSNVPANIQNWAISKYYYTGQCVLVDGIIYRCKTAHTSAATKFEDDSANWEQIGGVGGAAIWQASKPYSEGQLIIKDNIIYRCNTKHTSSTDFKDGISNWDIVNANIVEWKVSTYYPKGTIVQHDSLFFKNTVAGVSDSADFENDRANWILMSNVPANLQAWQANKYYYAGQSILKDKNIYVCTNPHLSDTTFDLDLPNWTATGSSTLNEWATKTTYTVGDIVITNDKIYQCLKNHTSDVFATDLNAGDWKEISSYRIVIDDWKPSTKYIVGDLVANDKKIYRCVTSNTSDATAFKNDKSYWEELSPTINEIADWTTNVKYEQKDLVIYNNSLYRCNIAHTSTTDLISDIQNWELLSNIQEWESNKTYIQGSIVLYDNTPYKVIKDHVSNDFSLDKDNFEITYSNIRDFNASSYYKAGSYVLYNNNIYKALKDTTGDIGHNWQKITNTQKPSIETWKTGTDYKKNEIVVYNEKIYKCAVDHTSGTDFSVDRPKYWESLGDNPIINDWISGNNYTVGTCVIKSNQNGIVDWTASKQYNVNDEVIYDGYIYICKTQNTDTEFTESNWEVKEPVYNRIYRCIKNTNSKNFNESEWQLINGDSKATADEVDELLA